MTTNSTRVPSARRLPDVLFGIIAAVVLLFLGASLVIVASSDHPMSFLDEHVHYDTALKMQRGELSYRGALYEEEVVTEWACGVGHEAGGLVHGCGDPRLNVRDVTSGQYTTGYIHYPTYFLGAAAFRGVVDTVMGPRFDLTVYRVFSALVMWAGLVACGVFAYALGLRRWALLAAVTVPASATSILVMGTMVTPNSTSLLAGALIAGTGMLWIKRGRGFIWLACSAAFGASTAVINSLPLGGFLFLIVLAVIGSARGWRLPGAWRPRLWHAITLGVIIVLPVFLWGRYISATATASNADVYGPYQLTGWKSVFVGLVQELFAFHSPWTDWSMGMPPGNGLVSKALRAAAAGIPLWVTIIVVGIVILAIVMRILGVEAPTEIVAPPGSIDDAGPRWFDAHRVLAAGTMITLILYPVALRFSNALTFGIDYGIVTRYSMAFAPLLVLLALTMVRNKPTHVVLAVVGTVGAVATAGVWL